MHRIPQDLVKQEAQGKGEGGQMTVPRRPRQRRWGRRKLRTVLPSRGPPRGTDFTARELC